MKLNAKFCASKALRTDNSESGQSDESLTFLKSNFKYKRRFYYCNHGRTSMFHPLHWENTSKDWRQQACEKHCCCDIGRVLKKSDNFILGYSLIRFIIIFTIIIYRLISATLRHQSMNKSRQLFASAMILSTSISSDNDDDDDNNNNDDDDNVSNEDKKTLYSSEISTHSIKSDSSARAHGPRNIHIPILMAFLLISAGLISHHVEAGACWRKNLLNGKCTEIFSLNITKSECCSTSEEFSFTDRELTSVEYFFATAIGGGMECTPCIDNCKNVACGPNKKCAKRRGRPKCICALECGATAKKHSKFFLKSVQHIGDNFPLTNYAKTTRDIRSLSSEIVVPSISTIEGFDGSRSSSSSSSSDGDSEKKNFNQRKKIIIISSDPTRLNINKHNSEQKHISSISNTGNTGTGITSRRHIVMSMPTVTRHQVISSNSNLNARTNIRRNKSGKSLITAANTAADGMIKRNSPNNDFSDLPSTIARDMRMKSAITVAAVIAATNRNNVSDFSLLHRQKQQRQQQKQQQQHHHNRHQFRKQQQAAVTAAVEANSKRKIKDHNNSIRGKSINVNVYNKMATTTYADKKLGDPKMNVQKSTDPRKIVIVGATTAATTTTTTTAAAAATAAKIADDLTFDDRIYNTFYMNGFANPLHELTQTANIRYNHPVCGTDGRTYNTECQLRKRACRTDNADLIVAYPGHCRTTCNGVKCLNGLTCVEDHYTIPHCISCKISCLNDDKNPHFDPARAVCGVDGKTYKSVCDINRMVCRIGRSIAVAYPGPCRDDHATCSNIICGPKMTCLKDLVTHEPRCVSCRFKCSRKRRPGGLRFEDGKICGTNNRSYHSWCEMRKDSCSTGLFIDVKSLGDC